MKAQYDSYKEQIAAITQQRLAFFKALEEIAKMKFSSSDESHNADIAGRAIDIARNALKLAKP